MGMPSQDESEKFDRNTYRDATIIGLWVMGESVDSIAGAFGRSPKFIWSVIEKHVVDAISRLPKDDTR